MSDSIQIVELIDSQRKSGIGTDVILVCGGNDFPAHKIILSTVSDYFKAMFRTEWQESGNKIELPTVSTEEIEIILTFLYTGKIKDFKDPDLLKALLQSSHMLQINALFEHCYKKLCEKVGCYSCLEIFHLADLYNDERMTKHVITFLARHFKTIIKSEEFLRLNPDQLQKIIDHLDTYNSSMDTTIKGLIRWAEVNISNEGVLLDVFNTIDLRDVSTPYLMKLLHEEAVIKKNYSILILLTAEATTRLLAGSETKGKILFFEEQHQKQVSRMYDVRRNQWYSPKALPFHLDVGMSSVPFGGYVFVFGGAVDNNGKPSSNVIKYSPETNSYTISGQLATPVYGTGVGMLHKSIYAVNGVNEQEKVVKTVQRYNPITGCCQQLANTNNSYCLPYVFTFSDYLYIFGSSEENTTNVERYDPEFDEWTVITSVPVPVEACMRAFVFGKLFVATSHYTNELQVYDLNSDTWVKKKIKGSPNMLFDLYSVALEKKNILLIQDQEHTFHSYDVEYDQWLK